MLRREVLRAAVMTAAGGLPPKPLNAPRAVGPSPGIQPGQSSGIIRARQVIIYGPNDGWFIYSGTPKLGNPPVAWGDAPGTLTDPFGNALPASQIVSYDAAADQWVQLASAAVNFGEGSLSASLSFGSGGLTFQTPDGFTTFDNGVQFGLGVVFLPPSGDTTGVTDWAAISAVNGDGYVCVLLPGTFYIEKPLVIANNTALRGWQPSWGIPSGNYGAGGIPLQGAIIQAGSLFTTRNEALIEFNPFLFSTQQGGQQISAITLSGTGAPAGTSGIWSQGYVGGVLMRDVTAWNMPEYGLFASNDGVSGHNPDFWRLEGCKFSDSGNHGVSLQGMSDSWFTDCESTGNGGDGWNVTGGADTRWSGCRGESNSGNGWTLDPTTAGAIKQLTGCTGNLNTGYGFEWTSGSVESHYLVNCVATGNTAGPYSYAAGAAVSTAGGNFRVWRPMLLQNSWANAAGNVAAQFALCGDQVLLIGALDATAATAAQFYQLPNSAYIPASQQQLPAGATGGQVAGSVPFIQCDTSGNLTVNHDTIGAADTYVFSGALALTA